MFFKYNTEQAKTIRGYIENNNLDQNAYISVFDQKIKLIAHPYINIVIHIIQSLRTLKEILSQVSRF